MSVKIAFYPEILTLKTADLVPLRTVDEAQRRSRKYKQIAASLKYVGLIEPLAVYAADGRYVVLDGNTRLDILRQQNITEVRCLLATDNEAYTYDKRVNYLSPIGEHQMILRAIAHGVTEEEIAAALDYDVATIQRKRSLLVGICPEATELLKDRPVSAPVFSVLRKMKAVRQVEAARLIIAARKYTARFAKVLLAGTRSELLVDPEKAQATRASSPTQKAMLEQETDELLKEFTSVQESYGTDVVHLSVSCRYVERILANARIRRHLDKHHPSILQELDCVLAEVNTDKTRVASQVKPKKARRAPNHNSVPRAVRR